jgi:hypothetical protein
MEHAHERRKKSDKSKDKAGRPSQKYVRAVEALLATPKQVPVVVTKKKGP